MHSLLWRAPRLAAWLAAFIVIGVATVGGIYSLRAMSPSLPAGLRHAHGTIIAVRDDDDTFELEAVTQSGKSMLAWFHCAVGARISLDHLRRHLNERAATDVTYTTGAGGVLLAWTAD